MANRRNGTIYLGVTGNLPKRVYEHRNDSIEGFTKKYECKMLVWYEQYDDIQEVRATELRMKVWNRQWKLKRIERMNPDWRDLYEDICR